MVLEGKKRPGGDSDFLGFPTTTVRGAVLFKMWWDVVSGGMAMII